jgi:hypothetical protein
VATLIGSVIRGRTLPGVPFQLRWRFGQAVSWRRRILFVRRALRLALLAMRSRTLRPARVLATLGATLGVIAGLVNRLRFGRGLLVGMGYRAPIHRLLRVRPYGVLSDGLLGTL